MGPEFSFESPFIPQESDGRPVSLDAPDQLFQQDIQHEDNRLIKQSLVARGEQQMPEGPPKVYFAYNEQDANHIEAKFRRESQ